MGLLLLNSLAAQVPQIINYQGRITVRRSNFNGQGQFKFSLVNSNGTVTFWSNDGTGVSGAEPKGIVPVLVDKGSYAVALGDTAIPNMTPIPIMVFTNTDVRLRVWFSDGNTRKATCNSETALSQPNLLAGQVSATYYLCLRKNHLEE